MNKPFDINLVNMMLSWISIFILSWFILLRRIPVDGISVFFFCFFILVAVGAWLGTVIEEKQSNPKGESK